MFIPLDPAREGGYWARSSQNQFVQHLSQKNPEAILLYDSIGKDVSVYQLSFTICVDNGQLLGIFLAFL
jgi:hypothetical protein